MSQLGHGRLGLVSALRPFSEFIEESAGTKIVLAEMRGGRTVADWSAYSADTYVAAFGYSFGGVLRDVVGVRTGTDTGPGLLRVDSIAVCDTTAGSYFYDPAPTITVSGVWDDGGVWDVAGDVWDDVVVLYVHLEDGSNPNATTVLAELGFFVSNVGIVHPTLSEDRLLVGGFESWTDVNTPNDWSITVTADGPFGGHPTLANNLVSYWKLDEASGVRYDSVTASANDLTDNNTVTVSPAGPSGVVGEFTSANNEYLSCGNILTIDANFSLSGWFNVVTTGDVQTLFYGGGGNFYAHVGSGAVQLFTRAYNDSVTNTATSIGAGWAHFVAYHDATNNLIGIAINGGAFVTAATGGTNGAGSLTQIGYRGDRPVSGNLARYGAWTRVLTAADVTSLYNSGNGKSYADLTTADKVSLLSYWNMDEVSGTRADSHGANTLTDNNTVTSVVNAGGAMRNGAAKFVAANAEYLSLADSASTVWGEDGNGATVSLWFRPTANPISFAMLFGRDAGTSQFGMYLDNNVITAAWIECVAGSNVYTSFATGFVVDTWYHVVFWFDPADKKMRCSINDTLVATTAAASSSSLSATTDAVTIGKRLAGYPTGQVDEVGVWVRSLLAQERTDLDNSGNGLTY